MCIDQACGSGGESSSGPAWESPDRNLINDILLAPLLSRFPKGALQGMMKNPQFSGFLDRVYGSGPTDEENAAINAGNGNFGGSVFSSARQRQMGGGMNPAQCPGNQPPEDVKKAAAAAQASVEARRAGALNNVGKFNNVPETNYEDMQQKYRIGNAWRPKLLG